MCADAGDGVVRHLSRFASHGLRTLVFASKPVDLHALQPWLRRYNEARCAVRDRDGQLDAAFSTLLEGMHLLGATALEDKLQDGVPETLRALQRAGIQTAMATGDKMETAVKIGFNCGLLRSATTELFTLPERTAVAAALARGGGSGGTGGEGKHEQQRVSDGSSSPWAGMRKEMKPVGMEQGGGGDGGGGKSSRSGSSAAEVQDKWVDEVRSVLRACAGNREPSRSSGGGGGGGGGSSDVSGSGSPAAGTAAAGPVAEDRAIVMDGATFQLCAERRDLRPDLTVALGRCRSAIFCRMTPSQKAGVVKLVKRDFRKVCLAIGDGANDVSMILESNVGVGLAGKEGAQAAYSADFVLHRFRHLVRLITVHGRYAYWRVVKLVRLIFFMNLAFNLPQLFFSFFSALSGTTIFPSVVLTCYSPIYMAPVWLGVGVFDRDLRQPLLGRFPELYRGLIHGRGLFSPAIFLGDLGMAVLHAGFVSLLTFGVYWEDVAEDPKDGGLWSLATAHAAMVIATLQLHCACRIVSWTW